MEVKGKIISIIPRFIKSKFGEEEYKKWLASLNKEAQCTYSGIVLPDKFYENIKYYVEPTRKMCEFFYKGSLKGAFEVGMYDAKCMVEGVCNIFVKIASPKLLLKWAIVFLQSRYVPILIEVVDVKKRKATLRIIQFDDIKNINEQIISGWLDMIMEINGANNLKINIPKSYTRGDKYTEIVLSWE